jgi:hypothetical protein
MGDMEQWVVGNWFDLLSTFGIIASLLFTAVSFHSETKTRRIANLLTITANYRELWKEFLNQPKLARVLDPLANLESQPVTLEEELFVNMVILHTCSAYYAINDELLMKLEGSRRDIAQFFSLPIPSAVWAKAKLLQNQDFAAFIDSSSNGSSALSA